ncbi:putative bifunctional dihydrofolate reductase-thymidylate synthase isoform X2 [Magnolia sinica]|uniref:putative bifunctional dihydrofolate reductase-thymidylate synthase isoform X2 n=1 Tax=Magnolia sinica TaxID=86752 RepID=UPI002658013B|nr:putative bifunctional dihydrofolate reductase-thymidylate synthase isoform X2 [Magnolia sinica]
MKAALAEEGVELRASKDIFIGSLYVRMFKFGIPCSASIHFRKVPLPSYKRRFFRPAPLRLFRVLNKIVEYIKPCLRFSVMAGDVPMALSNGNANTQHDPQRTFQVVVAATRDMGIGKDGKLPWKLPSDMKFFKEVTMATADPVKKNAVVMGRKTWESIPLEHRPLPGRLNVVLTRSGSFDIATAENVVMCGSMSSALELLAASPYCLSIEKVFVIGGGQVLRESLNAPGCDAIHITEIETSIECDTFIPSIDLSVFQPWCSSFPLVENGIRYSFVTYVRVRSSVTEPLPMHNGVLTDSNSDTVKFEVEKFSFLPKKIFERHEEYLYLRLVQDIISSGAQKDDRTGTGTLSKFGCQMRFNLRKSFPLLTTKKVFWRGVVEELLWFISGSTNAKVLQEKGIRIWDGNASRDFLDSIGLADREEGDLGPIYGFQWRHFGAKYIDMHADYTGKGFDQLLDVIHKIKNSPDDRRIVLSAWNPSDLKLMALPPCHMFAQFYVANGELSCQMYQRSADMGLGVPFNIASYALLTSIIAHVCDLIPGDFIHVLGDAHVYRNHVRPLQEQLQKLPKPFPILKINTQKKDIDSFVASDFKLIGYDPHQKIEMKMAV